MSSLNSPTIVDIEAFQTSVPTTKRTIAINQYGGNILLASTTGLVTAGSNVTIGATGVSATVASRKLVLFDDLATPNNFQYYGLGVGTNILKYSIKSTSQNHIFYAGASTTTETELFRVRGAGGFIATGNSIIENTVTDISLGMYPNNSAAVQIEAYQRSNFSTKKPIKINYTGGEVTVGDTSASAARKLVLFDNGLTNNFEYYGFGIAAGTLKYQVNSTISNHIFYAATSSTTEQEVFRINGNGGFTTTGPGTMAAATATTLNTSGLATVNSLAVTNNATVGGTLAVTGVISGGVRWGTSFKQNNQTVGTFTGVVVNDFGGFIGTGGVSTLTSNATGFINNTGFLVVALFTYSLFVDPFGTVSIDNSVIAYFQKNGVTTYRPGSCYMARESGLYTCCTATAIISMNASDYVELIFFNNQTTQFVDITGDSGTVDKGKVTQISYTILN